MHAHVFACSHACDALGRVIVVVCILVIPPLLTSAEKGAVVRCGELRDEVQLGGESSRWCVACQWRWTSLAVLGTVSDACDKVHPLCDMVGVCCAMS